MRFAVREEATSSAEHAPPSATAERPRHAQEPSARPAPAPMPAVQREAPRPIDEASARSSGAESPAASPPRERPRRGASSWWHAALAGGALAAILTVFGVAPIV